MITKREALERLSFPPGNTPVEIVCFRGHGIVNTISIP